MLTMEIWTWDPAKREALTRRWQDAKKHPAISGKKIKLQGKWHDVSGSRMFVVYDHDNMAELAEIHHNFLDIATLETVHLLDDKEAVSIAEKAFNIKS
jgi:hypothetical protein